MTGRQQEALAAIKATRFGGITESELAAKLGTTKSAAARMANALLDQGYVHQARQHGLHLWVANDWAAE